ncbi:MAG: hypothetical protein Q6363_007470 [Candidatus Njordarchaeota archaeon]
MIEETSILSILAQIFLAWKNEIENENLTMLEDKFLQQIYNLITTLRSFKPANNIEKDISDVLSKILVFIYNDIKSSRIIKALFTSFQNQKSQKNLTPREKILLKKIETTIKSFETLDISTKGLLDSYLITYDISKDLPKRTLCVSSRAIRKFVGEDSIVYRGIQQGSILFLPTKNFEIFTTKKARISKIEVID